LAGQVCASSMAVRYPQSLVSILVLIDFLLLHAHMVPMLQEGVTCHRVLVAFLICVPRPGLRCIAHAFASHPLITLLAISVYLPSVYINFCFSIPISQILTVRRVPVYTTTNAIHSSVQSTLTLVTCSVSTTTCTNTSLVTQIVCPYV
jgi:hypothetical protein